MTSGYVVFITLFSFFVGLAAGYSIGLVIGRTAGQGREK